MLELTNFNKIRLRYKNNNNIEQLPETLRNETSHVATKASSLSYSVTEFDMEPRWSDLDQRIVGTRFREERNERKPSLDSRVKKKQPIGFGFGFGFGLGATYLQPAAHSPTDVRSPATYLQSATQ